MISWESEEERARWNRKYGEGSHTSLEPDPFLLEAYEEFVAPLFPAPGAALDVAGGVGRHAIWLAQRGWQVTLVDISEVGTAKASENAAVAGVPLRVETADLLTYNFGHEAYNLILVFFYLQRELFSRMAAALKPGGLIVYKTYTREHQNFARFGLQHPMFFLEPNELLHAFPGLHVLHYRETLREKGVAELVAWKEPS